MLTLDCCTRSWRDDDSVHPVVGINMAQQQMSACRSSSHIQYIYIFFFSFSIFLWQKFRVPVNDDSFEWLYNKQQIQQQQQKQSLFRISDMYPIAPQAGTSTPKHNKSQYRRYSRVRSFCVFPNRSEWKLIIMLWKSCCDVVCFCVRILVSFILFGNCLLYQYDM